MKRELKMQYLKQIIDYGGEVRIGHHRYFKSLVQVYIDKKLIAESEDSITELEDALLDVNEKICQYVEKNW